MPNYEDRDSRGFFAIGIENVKTLANLGSLWRTAILMGASYVFTIGEKYVQQKTDTCKAPRHIPCFNYKDWNDFRVHVPQNCDIVGVELDYRAKKLESFCHPPRAIYLLGNETVGLSQIATQQCRYLIQLSTKWSLNVACCGSMIMWDRVLKESLCQTK